MNKYPEYIEIGSKKYKINTDFRLALRCDEIYRDESIGNTEKNMAIIYILLGSEALSDRINYDKILDLLAKYLTCNKDINNVIEKEPSMNYKQDEGYIKASFMSDYGIDLDAIDMHWWQFYDLLQGLTDNSVLSRVRTIREEPLSDKKGKELQKWIDAKKSVELKKEKTQKEKELDKYWEDQLKRKCVPKWNILLKWKKLFDSVD